jgi:hypothetical protein
MPHAAHTWRRSPSRWSGSTQTWISVCISVYYTVLVCAGTCILQTNPYTKIIFSFCNPSKSHQKLLKNCKNEEISNTKIHHFNNPFTKTVKCLTVWDVLMCFLSVCIHNGKQFTHTGKLVKSHISISALCISTLRIKLCMKVQTNIFLRKYGAAR